MAKTEKTEKKLPGTADVALRKLAKGEVTFAKIHHKTREKLNVTEKMVTKAGELTAKGKSYLEANPA